MIIYIAGPMSGLPDFYYPAFLAAAAELRAKGFNVVCPAENDLPLGRAWADYMRHAITRMMGCDAVALLPGWTGSRGAQLEHAIACELGMPVRAVAEWLQ